MNASHLYVHVPFCARRCSYCAFHISVRKTVPVDRFIKGLESELKLRFGNSWQTPLRSLYLGGGTPSLLGEAGVASLLRAIRDIVPMEPTCEISLEANPEDVTEIAADSWFAAGVNRVSVGVQTLSDPALQWMHRVHNGDAARRALRILTARFRRVSADLIFSLPESLARDLSGELTAIVEAGVGHISIYGLTVEERTPFARWLERGECREAPDTQYASEYLQIHRALSAEGFDHYEVSSFARPGERSIHNSAYWNGSAYMGAGPAAHGFDGSVRRWNIPEFTAWVEAVERGSDPLHGSESLTAANRIAEGAYLGLRVADGIRISEAEVALVSRWTSEGWGNLDRNLYRLTPEGWLRLDSLAYALTAARSR